MPKGWCPEYLYNDPELDKKKFIEDIWEEIQGYNGEFRIDDALKIREGTEFICVLPPLYYKGRFIKGLFLSQGVDYIHSLFPRTNELFISMAWSMWSSLPTSDKADVYLACFDYPEREKWFKNEYPDKKDKMFLPLQDADFTNEFIVKPAQIMEKDIDVLCVSNLTEGKNLPLLVKCLKLYHEKYNKILKAVLITGIKDKKYIKPQQAVLQAMEEAAGGNDELEKYIEILGYVRYGRELNYYYTRSKLTVLTSIYEGKNRAISEANLCNTPVVVFKDLSKFTRGADSVLPEGCGFFAPEFSVESFCDTIHESFKHLGEMTPRAAFLEKYGRMNFLNKCIDSLPYYRENLPGYEPGNIENNKWVEEAMIAAYQVNLNAFLYCSRPEIHYTHLSETNTAVMDFYNNMFNIKGGEKVLPQRKDIHA